MPFPTDEMRAAMKAMRMKPTMTTACPGTETWAEVDNQGDHTENYVTFYPDTEPYIEGDIAFCRRILAFLPADPLSPTTRKEE